MARVAWDAILIAAALFAAASATFALLLHADLPLRVSIIVAAATSAAVSLLIGAAVAMSRAAAARNEAAREAAEGRLEAAELASADALLLCRRDSRRTVIAASERLEAITGYPRDRFVSGVVALSDLVETSDAEAIGERIAAALTSGSQYRVIYGLNHLSGRVRRVEETGRLVRPGGTETVTVLRDVTDKTAIERTMRQMQGELRLLRDRSPFGIVYFDGTGGLRGMNAAAARLLGTPRDDKSPRSLFSLFHPESEGWDAKSLPRFVSAIGVVMVAGETGARLQAWLVPATPGDGGDRVFVAFVFPAPPVPEPAATEAPATAAPPQPPIVQFAAALGREFARARRFDGVFSVVALSVAWRDDAGNPVERDADLAAAVEDVCRDHVRGVDTLADLGGGMLAVILPESGSRAARVMGERLRRAVVEIVFARDTGLVRPVPSVGAARIKAGDAAPDAVLQRALDGTGRARERGGNQVVVA